ncbi:MAG: helix-turn-helix domain-containing protein, partial [Methylococcales bacterium]
GLSLPEICRLADRSSTTVTQYLKGYQAHGLDGLRSLNFRRPKSELESFRETLKTMQKSLSDTILQCLRRSTPLKRKP